MAFQGWLKDWWDLLALALLGAMLLFLRLDAPLLEPDESRYAEIPRLMLRSGDWITPKLQGKAYNDKPPLVYWLVAGSYALFGVSIESARVVPALAGWLLILVIYAWTRKNFNRFVGFLSGLILLSMLGYIAMMRMLLLDGVFSFLVVSSLLSGHHALSQNRHSGWWLISACLCGLAVLAKGPVAIVLITPALFALRWLDRSLPRVRFQDCLWYGLVVVAIALPWYAAMMLTNDSFSSEHFFRHHLRRFFDPAHHERPFWFYLPVVFVELMPWSFLAIAVMARWRTWTGSERFLLCFSFFCFVFFSIARAKLPTYLLPMLPTLGILIGNQLQRTWKDELNTKLQSFLLSTSLIVMLLGLSFRDWGIYWKNEEVNLKPDVAALAVASILCLWTLATLLRGRLNGNAWLQPRWMYSASMVVALFVSWQATHQASSEYAESVSLVKPCVQIASLAEKEGIPYAAYRGSWDAISFQLNGEELEVISGRDSNDLNQWLVAHSRCMIWMRNEDKRTAEFADHLPPGVEIEQKYELGRVHAFILAASSKRAARP